MWGAEGIKLAVTGRIIWGFVAENAGFGRNCAFRSTAIAGGRPANGVASVE